MQKSPSIYIFLNLKDIPMTKRILSKSVLPRKFLKILIKNEKNSNGANPLLKRDKI